MSEQFDGEYSLFIGRWQTPYLHRGHMGLINVVLEEGGKVCIAIRDTKKSGRNPYSTQQRYWRIHKAFEKEMKEGRVKIIIVPDIKEVCYGRKVGWGIREIRLDEETEAISATEIRERG